MKIDRDKLNNYINQKWAKGCPICGEKSWGVDYKLQVFIPGNEDGSIELEMGDKFPVTLLTCDNCSYVAMLSPLLAEVIKE